ncbi:MAG: hypothetical protein AB1813_12500 [Verrucomicrobiota bacterium]
MEYGGNPFAGGQRRTNAAPSDATSGRAFNFSAFALAHLDKFSHTGVFSGGGIAVTNITDMAAFKEKVKLVFVSYGSRELGGDRTSRGGDPKANTEALKVAGINAHFYLSLNTAHEWQSWRRSLREFAPLLFKN